MKSDREQIMNIIETDSLPVDNDWNKFLTFVFGIFSFAVSLYNRSIFCIALLVLTYIFFPLIYIFLRFLLTDCINKKEIIESKFEMGKVMKFTDSDRNCYVSEFVEEMNSRGNFWLTLISVVITVFSFI